MKIPAGTTAYIGAPANPIPTDVSDAIGSALGKIPDVLEAHLPMVYVQGHIDPPAQVLVIVVEENRPSPASQVMEALRTVLPTNAFLDITEVYLDDPQLPIIRETDTRLNLNRKLK
jgi:hypothetical protein